MVFILEVEAICCAGFVLTECFHRKDIAIFNSLIAV